MTEEKYTPPLTRETFGKRTYCGPTILMLLTGKDRTTVHADINKLRGRRSFQMVRGVPTRIIESLLEKYGMKPERVNVKGMTLKTFCEDVKFMPYPIVIITKTHYSLLWDGKVYDTMRPAGEPFATHPCARKHMEGFWCIRRTQPLKVTA